MDNQKYSHDFFRGITDKQNICDGYVMCGAFKFDEPIRSDGYKELSINWNDNDDALQSMLDQKKEDDRLKFPAGAARLDLANVKLTLSSYINDKSLSYERRIVDGNPYHGNLLISGKLDKRIRSMVSNGLALVAGTNIYTRTIS
ncbi:MAG: hypothetical protein AB9880_10035 [Christensenellales bacterium]